MQMKTLRRNDRDTKTMSRPESSLYRATGRELMLIAATRRYWHSERVQISSLARELGVGRASAYRWFGDNDGLLAEVLIGRIDELFHAARTECADTLGRERVLCILESVLRHAAESERFAALLEQDPKRLLKIFASNSYPVRQAITRHIERLLPKGCRELSLRPAMPSDVLATTIGMILEARLYAYAISGERPNIEAILRHVAVVVPEPPSPRAKGTRRS